MRCVHRYFAIAGLASLMATLSGCFPNVPATNPFDPETPVEAQKKSSLTGVVVTDTAVDNTEGSAKADAKVEIIAGPTKPENNPVTTKDDGAFEFNDLVPGTYEIKVSHPEHPAQSPRTISLEPGEDRVIELVLPNRPMIQGELPDDRDDEVNINYTLTGQAKLGSQGAVMEDAQDHSGIVVQVRTQDETPTSIQMTTGRDGRFGFSLNPGEYKLYLSARDHKSESSDILAVVDGEVFAIADPIVLAINPGSMKGQVHLEGAAEGAHDGITVSLVGTDKAPITDENGDFTISDIGAGVHALRLSKEGYDTREVAGIVVNAGLETELGSSFVLKRSRGTFKGRVTLAGATSSDGVAVQITSADGEDTFTTVTNADGGYRFEQVPVGTYSVRACKQGYLEPAAIAGQELTADEVRSLDDVTMNRPVITFTPQAGQSPGQYFTNEEVFRLRFDEVPVEQLTGVKVSGAARIAMGAADEQGWVNGQVTADETGAYIDLALTPNDGSKRIDIQFRNDGCFVSDNYQVDVGLDRTPPLIFALAFEEGRAWSSRAVTLVTNIVGADRFIISGDVVEVDSEALQGDSIDTPAKVRIPVLLAEGDGKKTVTVLARDAAGNITSNSESATITLDTEAPTNVSVVIADGRDYVSEQTVAVAVEAEDSSGIDAMMLSNVPSFQGARWVPFNRIVPDWKLADDSNGDSALFGQVGGDGLKTVYARFRDTAGNVVTVEDAASDSIELDRLGNLTIRVVIDGPVGTPATDVTILRSAEETTEAIEVNLGNPNADGELVVDKVPTGTYYLSAQLENFYVDDFPKVIVNPKTSIPAVSRLTLKYDTGTLIGRVNLAEATECPPDIQIQTTNLDTNAVLNAQANFQPDCSFSATLPIGQYKVTINRVNFTAVDIDNVEIKSFKTYDLGERILPRARGSVEGNFNLQGRLEHDGINITLRKQLDPTLGETAPTYTTQTVAADADCLSSCVGDTVCLPGDDSETCTTCERRCSAGRFGLEGLWAGSYSVTAVKDGFEQKTLSNLVVVVGGESTDATTTAASPDADDKGVVVLERLTGDFLINGGADYTKDPNVTVELEFTAIRHVRYRVNGGLFSDWILWQPGDDGKVMNYGITLPSVDEADDSGERVIEIQTRTVQGAESSEPYYQSSIILDQLPPENQTIEINGGATYTRSRIVNLSLLATDANTIYRMRLSTQDDCTTPNQPCEDESNPFCDTELYSPNFEYTLNTDQDGRENIYVCYLDPAGNVSSSAMASIILDRQVPIVRNLTVEDIDGEDCAGACKINSSQLKFKLTEAVGPAADTDSTTNEVWLSLNDPEYGRGAWQVFQTLPASNTGRFGYEILEDDGEYTLYIQAKDEAGNIVSHSENDVLSITIDLDTTPPVLPATDANEYFVREAEVGVTFSNATDEIQKVQWSWDRTWQDAAPVAISDTVSIPLPIVPGAAVPEQKLYTAYIRYWDAHNNPGPAKPIFVTYDTEAPTVSRVIVNYGNTYLAAPDNVPFEVTCTDRVAPTNKLQMSITQTNGATPFTIRAKDVYAPLVTASIRNEDGAGRIAVLCSDQAGNLSDEFFVDFNLDTQNPPNNVNWLRINNGDAYTDAATVTLTVNGVDNVGGSGIHRVALANGNIDCASAQYVSFTPGDDANRMVFGAWTLPIGEGSKTVSACLMDRAGRTVAVEDSIVLDTVAPQGGFSVRGATTFNLNTYVSGEDLSAGGGLLIQPTAGVGEDAALTQVGSALGDRECDTLGYQDYVNAMELDVAIGAPGEKLITMCFRDAAGNTTKYSRRIIYDNANPVIQGEPVVNLGQSAIKDANDVSVDITCTDDDTATAHLNLTIQLAGGGAVYDGVYAPRVIINVPADQQGTRTLLARCTDPAGNQSDIIGFDYVLDTVKPETGDNKSRILINSGADATNRSDVSLTIVGVDNDGGSGITMMAVGVGVLDCQTAQYEPFRAQKTLVLTAGDGVRTASVCLMDQAGNVAQVSDSITVDTAPPTGGFILPSGAVSSTTNVPYVLRRDDDDAQFYVVRVGYLDCDAPTTNYAAYAAGQKTAAFQGEGDYTLSLCLRDDAGNTTKYEERITIDSTAPTGFITINSGAPYTTTETVVVNITTSADVVEAKLSNQGVNCALNNGYEPVDLAPIHDLTSVDGPKTVRVCVRDAAGNTKLLSDTIELDTTAPIPVVFGQNLAGISIENNDSLTNGRTVSINLRAQDRPGQGTNFSSDINEFKLSTGDSCSSGAWQPWKANSDNLGMTIVMPIEEGDNVERSFSVKFRDKAGNESVNCASDSILVDTVPLALSNFSVTNGDDGTSQTSQRKVFINVAQTGTGSCAFYQISESPSFETSFDDEGNRKGFIDCDGAAANGIFTLSAGDGVKTLYARVRDAAGNFSASLVATIELDTLDPGLNSVLMKTSEGGNGNFTNSRDVLVVLQGATGGTGIRYQVFEQRPDSCDDVNELAQFIDFAHEFYVAVPTDGIKYLCLAVVDDAGRSSPTRLASIYVDTTPPTAPTLDPANLNGVNSSCVQITPSNVTDDNFWKFQYRQQGEDWQDSLTTNGQAISIDLYQDSDNIIEVRAVDRAGNPGESGQVFVEETSSVFIPTNLQIKQICNGGQYAILKDMSVKLPMFRNSFENGNMANEVQIARIPAVAILDLTTYEIRNLSPPISANDITDPDCNDQTLDQVVMDAACSAKAGESRLLVVSPAPAGTCIVALNGAAPPPLPYKRNRLWVYPDPIEQPLKMGSVLDANVTEGTSGVAVVSIDSLNWTNYDSHNGFKAVATTAAATVRNRLKHLRHHIRFITYSGHQGDPGTVSVTDSVDSVATVIAPDTLSTTIAGLDANMHHIRGLAHYGNNLAYLKYSAGLWSLYQASTSPTITTERVESFTAAATDSEVSPYNVLIGPAHFNHVDEDVEEARSNFLYLSTIGFARVRESHPNQETTTLASVAPSIDGHPWAPFFDPGNGFAHWVKANDPRTFVFSSNYSSTPAEQRYRHPMDTNKGIFPYLLGGGAGEAHVIYHTEGLNKGIVIGSKNEATCAE